MHFPPRVNRRVGDADLFDFFEVEEPLAVEEGVKGHDAKGRVEDGEGSGHGDALFRCAKQPREAADSGPKEESPVGVGSGFGRSVLADLRDLFFRWRDVPVSLDEIAYRMTRSARTHMVDPNGQ